MLPWERNGVRLRPLKGVTRTEIEEARRDNSVYVQDVKQTFYPFHL